MKFKQEFDNLIAYKKNNDFNVVIESKPKIVKNYKIEDISIRSYLGSKIKAYVVSPSIEGIFPAIHFIHWLETEADNSNRSEFLPLAIELAKQGYLSILPDCFWSLDNYKFKQNPEYYKKNWWKTDTDYDKELCKKQIIELKTIEDYLLSLDFVDKKRIGLCAHDFGAMFSVVLSSLGFKYKIYVLMAFTGRFSDWFRFGSKKTKEELGIYSKSMEFLDPIEHIKNITSSNILLQFGDNDFYVPKKKAMELIEALGEDKEIKWYQAKHNLNDEAFNDMKKWIIEFL